MTTARTKIWLGIGSFALVQALTPAAGDVGAAIGLGAAPASAAQAGGEAGEGAGGEGGEAGGHQGHGAGGEGGEGGEKGAAAGPLDDADYATDLHLMLGHLLVGEELVAMRAWNDALPHFAHPGEELYAPVAPELARRGADPFADSLERLLRLVKAKDGGPKFEEALGRARGDIRAAIAALPEAKRSGAGFAAEVIAKVLRTAADEYGEAFEDGKLVAVVEYQDSRGFVAEARAMLVANEASLGKAGAERLKKLSDDVTELARAYPAPLPPAQPVMDAAEVSALVSRIELDATRFGSSS